MITAIVGLGNAGDEYKRTYHNVGSFAARELAQLAACAPDSRELKVFPVSGFMNEIGGPVAAWLKLQNLSLAELVIAHDDSDLSIGTYKFVRGGGSAGHKGVESLIAHFGTADFWRLRIGVRDPRQVPKAGLPTQAPRAKAGEFVLAHWSKTEEEQFQKVCERAWRDIAQL